MTSWAVHAQSSHFCILCHFGWHTMKETHTTPNQNDAFIFYLRFKCKIAIGTALMQSDIRCLTFSELSELQSKYHTSLTIAFTIAHETLFQALWTFLLSAVDFSGEPISSQSFKWREDKHGSEFPERGIGIDFPLKPALVERERVSGDFISPLWQTVSQCGWKSHLHRTLVTQLTFCLVTSRR